MFVRSASMYILTKRLSQFHYNCLAAQRIFATALLQHLAGMFLGDIHKSVVVLNINGTDGFPGIPTSLAIAPTTSPGRSPCCPPRFMRKRTIPSSTPDRHDCQTDYLLNDSGLCRKPHLSVYCGNHPAGNHAAHHDYG